MINRMMKRLSAVAALRNFGQAPYPTYAKENVFDSKITAVEDLNIKRSLPIIVVYSDYDKNFLSHASQPAREKKTDDRRSSTLTFEVLIATAVEVDNGNAFELSTPQTDSELEVALDMIEVQIFEALSADNIAADTFKALTQSGYDAAISRRGASAEGGQKLAARQITVEYLLQPEFSRVNVGNHFDEFLTALEDDVAYGDLAAGIKEFLSSTSGWTPERAFFDRSKYSSEVAQLLGRPVYSSILPADYTVEFASDD